jgi:hypothetical protein
MAGTHVWRAAQPLATTSRRSSRSRRIRARLWIVLNAPRLLHDSTGGADSATWMEDDHRRFAAAPRGY